MGNPYVSVVIPLYNQAPDITSCITSLRKQSYPFQEMNIILVNDGSTDGSGEICRRICARYPNVVYLEQENRGVSAARNLGIRHAAGKYIFFLDADDQLASDTIKSVSDFFDTVYDDVDLVTYPLETIYQGSVLKPHFRYQFLKKSGIYDLCDNPFIGQTTMNIAVKNQFQQNILFDERQTFSEDQRYCCDVLKAKLKMGFCRKGKYLYYRSPESSSGNLSGSCFIFEQSMEFFESLFADYEHVPMAFQGLFVNDIYWKLTSNVLFPYHYGEAEYEHSIRRIKALLAKCYPCVILDHPSIDYFEKFYLMRLKDENSIQPEITDEAFSLYSEGYLVSCEKSIEMVLTKVSLHNGTVLLCGFLKSVFFQFYTGMPVLYAVENSGAVQRSLPLMPSAHNYYLSHEPTQRFWAMEYQCSADAVRNVRFEMALGARRFPVHYYFMPLVPFSHQRKKYSYYNGGVQLRLDADNVFHLSASEDKRKTRIWLYYDCKGVASDNGKLQFLHDLPKQDGVQRYYVLTDIRQKAGIPAQNLVEFGSWRHRRLLKHAEKVITAYIEENNIYPLELNQTERAANGFRFEVIYLQHGVLHIKMPWKYSPERIMADKIVVSTYREAQLYQSNGFREENLWKTRMPRFEKKLESSHNSSKCILYAPSWRAYLVGNNIAGKWQEQPRKFSQSTFFRNVFDFLSSADLYQILTENDYILEVKLHPIFACYRSYFEPDHDRIRFVMSAKEPEDYDLFITDFSSYLYDFVFAHIPVISFIPDIREFKCGMNGYRELNYDAAFWDNVSANASELMKVLQRFFAGESVNQIKDQFFDCDSPLEEIYRKLIN